MPYSDTPKSTIKLIIIADDLTGAFDASAPFCSKHTKVIVATSPQHLSAALLQGADVVAVSSQSREIPAEIAFSRVQDLVSQLPEGVQIFKKIDSRMKGNIASELDAFANTDFLVAPALPSFDRLVKNGKVCGFGVDKPIDIALALGHHCDNAKILDTHSIVDLEHAIKTQSGRLYVGARDLAGAIAKKWCIKSHTPMPFSGKIAIAIGSRDPITLRQIEALPEDIYHHISAPDGLSSTSKSDADIVLVQATTASHSASSETVAKDFAQSFIPLTKDRDCLVLSGGATAETLLNAMHIGVVELEGELLPGLPVAKAGPWRIATKSGGFGDPGTLYQLIEHSIHQQN